MSQNANREGSNVNDTSSLFDDTNSVVSHTGEDAESDPLFDDESEKSAGAVFSDRFFKAEFEQRFIMWGWDVTELDNSLLLQKQIRTAGLGSLWGRLKSVNPLKRPLLIVLQRADGTSARIVTGDSNENGIVDAILADTDQPTPADEDRFEVDSELAQELRKSGLSELLRRSGGSRKRTIDSTPRDVSTPTPKVSRQGNEVSLRSNEIGDHQEESFETATEVDDSLTGNHSVSMEERFERVVLIGPRSELGMEKRRDIPVPCCVLPQDFLTELSSGELTAVGPVFVLVTCCSC